MKTGLALGALALPVARVNLLSNTTSFDNIPIAKGSLSQLTAGVPSSPAPDGTNTGTTITNTVSSGDSYVRLVWPSGGGFVNAGAVVHSVYCKKGSAVAIQVRPITFGSQVWDEPCYFSFTTGLWTSTTGMAASGVIALPNGWFRIWVVHAPVAGQTNGEFRCRPADGANAAIAGETAVIWGPQVNAGTVLQDYRPQA